MSVDSIHKKKTQLLSNKCPKNPKNFIIPIIIIVIIIIMAWFVALRYNFSRINKNNQAKTDSTANKVNQTLDDLTQKLDDLKEQRIFSQTTSSEENASNTDRIEAAASTDSQPYSSEEIRELEQQY